MIINRLALIAALGLSVSAASAADLGYKKPGVVPVMAAYNWTGFYVGAQAGYSWSKDRTVEFVTATGAATGFRRGFSPDGFRGGAHVGYNYQLNNMFVIGAEADLEASGNRGGYVLNNGNGTRFRNDFDASLRLRAGITPVDRLLIYVTGGAAFANQRYSYFTPALSDAHTSFRTGWTAGVGAEYAITNNISLRAEYRYSDFGKVSHASTVAFPGFTYKHQPRSNTVRLGVSYKF